MAVDHGSRLLLHFSMWSKSYGNAVWGQIPRTSRFYLLKAVYIEEKRDMKKNCRCKLTLYNLNLLPLFVNITSGAQPFMLKIQARETRRILTICKNSLI